MSKKHLWNRQFFLSQLNALRVNHHSKLIEQGFTLIEALIAMLIVSITLAAVSPLFTQQKVKNINSEIQTGAVSVSQEILDGLRLRIATLDPGNPLPLGETKTISLGGTEPSEWRLGKKYEYIQHICTQEPTLDNNDSVTSCSTAANGLERFFVHLEIVYGDPPYEKTVYTVETIYTEIGGE